MAMVGGVMGGGTRKSGEIRKRREKETAAERGLVCSEIWPMHLQDLKIYIYLTFSHSESKYTHSVTASLTKI